MTERFNLDAFVAAYIETMYFTDTGEHGQPASDAPLHADAKARAESECAAFLWRVYPYLDCAARVTETPRETIYQNAARDFWFTRNGHGVGFWEDDRWPVAGDILDRAAQSFGSVDVYEADAGALDTM